MSSFSATNDMKKEMTSLRNVSSMLTSTSRPTTIHIIPEERGNHLRRLRGMGEVGGEEGGMREGERER